MLPSGNDPFEEDFITKICSTILRSKIRKQAIKALNEGLL
jgi:hypothetical protein